ncbi:hypothetical protein BGZ50_006434 [Haplosporangium sp. Z 11]|nr:hypothetical protein BGZ50_006434 [Haplosporangium sp. Z 11]
MADDANSPATSADNNRSRRNSRSTLPADDRSQSGASGSTTMNNPSSELASIMLAIQNMRESLSQEREARRETEAKLQEAKTNHETMYQQATARVRADDQQILELQQQIKMSVPPATPWTPTIEENGEMYTIDANLVPVFNGRTDKNQLEIWIKKLKIQFACLKPSCSRRTSLALSRLSGPLQLWFFDGAEAADLTTLKKKSSVSDYIHEFGLLMGRITNMSEPERIYFFRRGLPKEINDIVAELEAKVRNVSAFRSLDNNRTNVNNNPIKFNNNGNKFRTEGTAKTQDDKRSRDAKQCTRCERKGHTAETCKTDVSKKCKLCGRKYGHTTEECFNSPNGANYRPKKQPGIQVNNVEISADLEDEHIPKLDPDQEDRARPVMIIQGSVGGVKGRVLVDTGCNTILIHPDYLERCRALTGQKLEVTPFQQTNISNVNTSGTIDIQLLLHGDLQNIAAYVSDSIHYGILLGTTWT